MTHDNKLDYTCPTCHTTVKTGIPHECSYMLCHGCQGTGFTGWRHAEICNWCAGTGKWVQKEEPPQDNEIGVMA